MIAAMVTIIITFPQKVARLGLYITSCSLETRGVGRVSFSDQIILRHGINNQKTVKIP